jgi:hypothetical protein
MALSVGFYFFPFGEAHVSASVYNNWVAGGTGGGTPAVESFAKVLR